MKVSEAITRDAGVAEGKGSRSLCCDVTSQVKYCFKDIGKVSR